MSKQIWNEGRVVGYSAYETYVKQHLATNPDLDPASEVEWLASTVAMGSSLLLKVPNTNSTVSEDTHSYVDITLPTNSRLGAANTIIASFFDGDGDFSEFTNWATKITNYGALVSNTSESSPQTSESEEDAKTKTPIGSLTTWEPKDSLEKKRLIDYMRIVDGVVIQPGQWDVIENKPPEKDQVQNLNTRPFVRLHIRGKISNNPRILLTGFTIRSVLAGVTSLDSSTDTRSPQDGDYLGPATYPWANRIVFSVPSSYIAYFEAGNYKRQLAKGGNRPQNVVSHTPVIDMKRNGSDKQDTAIDPHQFFTTSWPLNSKLPTGYKNNSVTYDVNSFSAIGDGLAVLVTYQKKQVFPPALYGSFVSSEGDNYMNPIDCVAPGAMKMFYNDDGTMMNEFEGTYPGTVAMSKDTSTGEISTLVDGKKRPVASVGIESFGGQTNLATRVKVGNKTVKSLAVSNIGENDVNPTVYPSNGANGDLTTGGKGKFNWSTLANALKNNKFVHVLKGVLKAGDGVTISPNPDTSDGPYTITNSMPFKSGSIKDKSKAGGDGPWLNLSFSSGSPTVCTFAPNIVGDAGIGVVLEGSGSSTKVKLTNLKPYNPGGDNFKYLDDDNKSKYVDITMQNNFTGYLSRSDSMTDIIESKSKSTSWHSIWHSITTTQARYVKNINVGFSRTSLIKNRTTGKYSGILGIAFNFNRNKGSGAGKKMYLVNGNLGSNLTMRHANRDSTNIKNASICTVKFMGILSMLNKVKDVDNGTESDDIWNVREVYKGSSKWEVRNPGGSFCPNFFIQPPVKGNSLNAFPYKGSYNIGVGNISDGWNTQYTAWESDRSGSTIIGTHLNLQIVMYVSVTDLDWDKLSQSFADSAPQDPV